MVNRQPDGASTITYFCLTLALAIFAIAPLFYPGYFQSHSGLEPLWNVADLRVKLGQWDWVPHIGLEFNPWRNDGLFPYYLAALLPAEPVKSVKIVFGLSWLLSSAGMFLWLKAWLGRPGALVAALVYTYLPWHIATIYVRGAWGEALVWGLLPWAFVIGQLYPAAPSNLWRFTSICSLMLWLLLGLSHLGLTLWGFVFFIGLHLITQPARIGWAGAPALIGVVLGVFINLTISASLPPPTVPHQFADHFLYPFQLFSAFWGSGPSRPGWNDGLSFQLGLVAVGLSSLSLFRWRQNSKADLGDHPSSRVLIYVAGTAVVTILLQFSFTAFFWNLLSGAYLNYPWQILGLTGLCLSVLAGVALRLDGELTKVPILAALIIFIILGSYTYLNPRFMPMKPELLNGPQAILGHTQLAVLAHQFEVESSGNTAGLELGAGKLPLAVYGLPRPKQTLWLNVTWQPLQPFTEDLKVFVHLVDAHNTVLAQFDGPPKGGEYPTSRWSPGELIEDSYPLTFPEAAPPGPYRVLLGLYNEATGVRLPVLGDAEGRVSLEVK